MAAGAADVDHRTDTTGVMLAIVVVQTLVPVWA